MSELISDTVAIIEPMTLSVGFMMFIALPAIMAAAGQFIDRRADSNRLLHRFISLMEEAIFISVFIVLSVVYLFTSLLAQICLSFNYASLVPIINGLAIATTAVSIVVILLSVFSVVRKSFFLYIMRPFVKKRSYNDSDLTGGGGNNIDIKEYADLTVTNTAEFTEYSLKLDSLTEMEQSHQNISEKEE